MTETSGIGRRASLLVGLVLLAAALHSVPASASSPVETSDAEILAGMEQINRELAAEGFTVAVGQVELFTIGDGRPIVRLIQSGIRFVPEDSRRDAHGNRIRYLVDSTASTPVRGDTTSGLMHLQTEAAIDSAITTWQGSPCLEDVEIAKRSPTADPNIFDFFLFGDGPPPSQTVLFQADVVHSGWLPFSGSPLPSNALAVTIVLFFVQGGQPTDVNRDGYADEAWAEIYYNDEATWRIDHDIDVETVALHESGHAFGLDHFGPPPVAVMNISYGGVRQVPSPTDAAGLCAVWGSWPH